MRIFLPLIQWGAERRGQHMKAIAPWEEDQALDREGALDHERTRRYEQLVFPSFP